MKRIFSLVAIVALIIFSQEMHAQTKNNGLEKVTKKEYDQFHGASKNNDLANLFKKNPKPGVIELELDNGKKIKFSDKSIWKYEENGMEYKFLGYSKANNRFLVEVKYYEDQDYLYIDKKNGTIDTLMNPPTVSPDHKYLCTHNEGWGMEGVPNGIKVYAFDNGKLRLRKRYIQEVWVPREVYWTNTTLYIKATPVSQYYDKNGNQSSVYEYYKVVMP